MKKAQDILATHHLRNTANRLAVLQLLMEQGMALSQPEIEQEMRDTCDRVTIYRTLSTFLDSGIVHKVLDDAGAMKYALCATGCHAEEVHSHNHVHFKCSACGHTTCLDEVKVPGFVLPKGYQLEESNILLQGVCPQCQG